MGGFKLPVGLSILTELEVFEIVLERAFWLVVLCSGIPLSLSAVAGLLISVLQAATQIQEQSISFLVKFSVISLVLATLGSWFATEIIGFMGESYGSIALIR